MDNNPPTTLMALDVGEKRIGLAYADTMTRIPVAKGAIAVDGTELEAIRAAYEELQASMVVIGFPRNQSGEPTAQTASVQKFAEQLDAVGLPYRFQDESLTSVLAEEYLQDSRRPYTKEDIDARAAAIILEDYLELHRD